VPDIFGLRKAESIQPVQSPGEKTFGSTIGPIAQKLADLVTGAAWNQPVKSSDLLMAILPIASPLRNPVMRTLLNTSLRNELGATAHAASNIASRDAMLEAFDTLATSHPRTMAAGVRSMDYNPAMSRARGTYSPRIDAELTPAGSKLTAFPGHISLGPDALFEGAPVNTLAHELTHAGQYLRIGDRIRQGTPFDLLPRANETTAHAAGAGQQLISAIRKIQDNKITAEQRRLVKTISDAYGKVSNKMYQRMDNPGGPLARSHDLRRYMEGVIDVTADDIASGALDRAAITEYLRAVAKEVIVPNTFNRRLMRVK
jgi:hypothetical protein